MNIQRYFREWTFQALCLTLVVLQPLFTSSAGLADSPEESESKARETDREVTRTYSQFYINENRMADAKQELVDHLKVDPEDASAWNVLGLIFMDEKDFERAGGYFFNAAKWAQTQDDRAVYLYNYADAEVQLGDTEKAMKALRLAARSQSVRESANDALDILSAGKPLPNLKMTPPTRFSLNIGLNSGYDSNVVLAADQSVATLQTSEVASVFLTPNFSLNHKTAMGHGTLESNLFSAFTWNLNSEVSSLNSLVLGLDSQWGRGPEGAPDFASAYGYSFSTSFINRDGLDWFSWSPTLFWKGTWYHGNDDETEFNVPVRYQGYVGDDSSGPDNRRSGFGVLPQITHRFYFGIYSLSLSGLYERHFARGINFKVNRFAFPITFGFPIWSNIALSLNTGFEYLNYFESTAGRKDKLFTAGLSLSKTLWQDWSFSVSYSGTRNISNSADAKYWRHAGTLSIIYGVL